MIEISGWLLVVIEQALIVLIFLTVFFYFRSRKLKKTLNALKAKSQQVSKEPAGSADTKELERLRDKIGLYEQSLKNLERFRDLFFDMKRKYEAYVAMQTHVLADLENTLPADESAIALKQALEKLRTEKERLEMHLMQIETELDMLMEHPHKESSGVETMTEELADAGQLVEAQQQEIQRLKQYVVDLTLEAALKDRITNSLQDLDKKNNELATALEILQDENQFLMDQIQALLQMDTQPTKGDAADMTALRERLANFEKDYQALQEKYVKLETEYLSMVDKNQS